MIPQDFPPYYSSMRNLAAFVIHLIATLARLLGPGGVPSLVALLVHPGSSSPFRNCTEALDTASDRLEQAKVPHAQLSPGSAYK